MDLRDLARLYLRGEFYENFEGRRIEYHARRKVSILEDIAQEFYEFIKEFPAWKFELMGKIFRFGRRIERECRIDLKDVEVLFNDILPRYVGGGMVGCFISGLYHDVMEDDDVLTFNLSRYRGSVSGLGFRHKRGALRVFGNRALLLGSEMGGGVIRVEGNVGNYLGRKMAGGRIEVEGNARDWVGMEMRGGTIHVKGNVGNAVGVKMEGGAILIDGRAGFWVGDDMRGGVIKVREGVMSVSRDRSGGKIYVWRNGWIEIEG